MSLQDALCAPETELSLHPGTTSAQMEMFSTKDHVQLLRSIESRVVNFGPLRQAAQVVLERAAGRCAIIRAGGA